MDAKEYLLQLRQLDNCIRQNQEMLDELRQTAACIDSVDYSKQRVKTGASDPLSPSIDHIIPVSKGGHPSAMENLQLAHWSCNRKKADSLPGEKNVQPEAAKESSEELPWSIDWTKYKGA